MYETLDILTGIVDCSQEIDMKQIAWWVGYFGWTAFVLVPSDMFRIFVVTVLAPAWTVMYLEFTKK